MKGHVIVIDVDGTLLPSNNIISDELKKDLLHFEKDNLVVLASGRSYHDLLQIHKEIGLHSPIISSNGASLDFFDDKKSITMEIRKEILQDLFKNNKEKIISSFYSYKNKIFIYNKLEKLNFLYKIKEDSIVLEGDFDQIDLDHPNNIYFIIKNDFKEQFFLHCDKFNNEISYMEFGHDKNVSIIILTLKHTDKAYALLELLMIMNKKESDTIIFGDNYADINMLKLNGITVAMSNAIDEAKTYAKYQTEYDNNNYGVIRFLKKLEKGLD